MNSRLSLSLFLAPLAVISGPLFAQEKAPEPPVPVTQAPTRADAAPAAGSDYQQRLYASGGALVAPEKANEILNTFRPAYDRLGKPRILFYVNRELVDNHAGIKLSGRKEHTETEQSESHSSFEADPNAKNPAGTPQTQVNVAVTGNAGSGDMNTPGKGNATTRKSKVTGENTYTATDET